MKRAPLQGSATARLAGSHMSFWRLTASVKPRELGLQETLTDYLAKRPAFAVKHQDGAGGVIFLQSPKVPAGKVTAGSNAVAVPPATSAPPAPHAPQQPRAGGMDVLAQSLFPAGGG